MEVQVYMILVNELYRLLELDFGTSPCICPSPQSIVIISFST